MLENPYLLLIASAIVAAIPVAIWLYIIFSKKGTSKKTLALVFIMGCFTAPALLLLQEVWSIFPRFNLSAIIESNIRSQTASFIAMFILFGAMEEIIKMYVLTIVDKKTLLIKTINDTIRYSLASALGFAFTENIYYLYQFWPSISTGQLVGMYVFRSLFTAAAHMIFSGIFGYFYAMGKFSIQISKQKIILEEVSKTVKWISKIFNLPLSRAYQQKFVIKGLFIAIFAHATYNFILQMGYKLPVILFVILGAVYIWFLMKTRTGNLIINTDISEQIGTKLGKKDKDVILELISMWFKEKRYVDVIHVCERLLERDPNNEVVKLFKAKSLDYLEDSNPYKKILNTIIKDERQTEENKNILSKYLEEKENAKKAKDLIKKQLEKEGKKIFEPKKQDKTLTNPENQIGKINEKEYMEKFTKGDSFKI
ncbi:MAG: PrsW family glutamic-type intramembrane protease [Candidatus Gracilibacteria bacterium]|jgi:RsiW-degrading membrane proteinase PrsW (M82 family)|nr:PrsW family glutamic-type intramembrane protease [Candidatus Gracilibacteria bacterium]